MRGRWRAHVSRDGSRFSYHNGGVTLDARAVFEMDGTALLFGEQFEIPFPQENPHSALLSFSVYLGTLSPWDILATS